MDVLFTSCLITSSCVPLCSVFNLHKEEFEKIKIVYQ